MSDTPPPGSSEWWPGSDYDDVTTWWPQPAFTVQRRVVAGIVPGGDYVRGSTTSTLESAYLTPTAADHVSTPDIGPLPSEWVCVWKVRPSNIMDPDQSFGGQWDAGQVSWSLFMQNGNFFVALSLNGTTTHTNSFAGGVTTTTVPNGVDVFIALRVQADYDGTNGRGTVLRSTNGVNWTQVGLVAPTKWTALHDSTGPIRAGTRRVGFGAFVGRMYSMEMHTGIDPNAGTVLWRFDANDYPGTGTEYIDPRGKTWSLVGAAAAAFTPKVLGTDVHQSALRFPTTSTFEQEELTGTGVFFARPIDYGTVELTWGTTLDLSKWGEISIVRSAMGMPVTVNDGQTIFRSSQAKLFPTGYTMETAEEGITTKPMLTTRKLYDPRSMPGAPTQAALPGGRWYYYSLFFRSGTKWQRYMVTSTLLPRNHHHAEHLFNNLPPYYQWTDDQMRGGAGDGDLRKFFGLIGFDFDLTKEYVDGWLDLYHTDFTPIPLLRRLGANFGMPYEAGLGDIRYRGLISKLGFLYRSRGTTRSLNEMVVSVMKCSCDVTSSPNIMLLPDDSDFFEGTGNWAGISPDTPLTSLAIPAGGAWTIPPTPLTPDKVRLEHGVHVVRPPDNSGRGVMRMWTSKADGAADVLIACGNGIAQEYNLGANPFFRGDDVFEGIRMLYPRYAGIPITPKEIYNFSVQIKSDYQPVTLRTVILWFNAAGDNQDLVGFSESGPGPIDHLNWETYLAQGIAPDNAAYAVPAMWFRNRLAGSDPTYSPFIYFTAAQFSRLGTAATVSASSPDRYLTLAAAEKIGPPDPDADPPFEGFLIGDPSP